MAEKYVQPEPTKSHFTCPHCGTLAVQHLKPASLNGLATRQCGACEEPSLFWKGQLVWPQESAAPEPNADLSHDIKEAYREAASIVSNSPRGAAALLRLSIEKLVRNLGGEKRKLNAAIGNLVKKGTLPEVVHQALDVVRVTGNNAVHPGQLDLADDRDRALSLFALLNLTADYAISKPKHVSELVRSSPRERGGEHSAAGSDELTSRIRPPSAMRFLKLAASPLR